MTALGANGAFACPGGAGENGEREAAPARGSPQPGPQGPDWGTRRRRDGVAQGV
jgi:hypothetical protein